MSHCPLTAWSREWNVAMRIVLLAACLGLGMLPVVIQPASAMQPCALGACGIKPAPAPVIGAGLPALFGVGGVWLGRKLLRRRKRQD
jgi:hypothetical protein